MYATTHDTVLVVTQVAAVLILILIFFAAHQARMKRKHEISKRLLGKMSSEQFLELLQSAEGRRSIERLLGTSRSAGEWVTDAIRRATLLLFVGPAFLLVFALVDFSGQEIFLALGALSIAIGVGYLVAAALTRGRAGQP
ncbi:hypothetical protein ABI59_16885 [Acidobacteria bacterium Mor1]|nr:hypothetical protein ABI59_16885 [Acidobacteria bacterium Mor1]